MRRVRHFVATGPLHMSYFPRAESLLQRGEIMRAFYVLVNGLRNDPSDEIALNMMVDIYIAEIDSPGLEADLLGVLVLMPNGFDIYEMIEATLEQSGDSRRLKSLLQFRQREQLWTHDPPPPANHEFHAPPHESSRHQSSFEAVTHAYPASHQEHVPPQQFAHPSSYPAQQPPHLASVNHHYADAHYPPEQPTNEFYRPSQPSPNLLDAGPTQSSQTHFEDDYSDNGESATTGMFSSIQHYLDEQHAELSEELSQRSRNRLLLIGAAVMAALVLLTLVFRGDSPATEKTAYGPEVEPNAVEITEPLKD